MKPYRRFNTALLLIIMLILPASGRTQEPIAFEKLAQLIVSHLDVQAGEKILLVGAPGRFDPLLSILRKKFKAANADFLGVWSVTGVSPDGWTTEFTAAITGAGQEELGSLLKNVDVSIMLPGATPEHAVYAAIQDTLRGGQGRTIHFHWAGAYGPDGKSLPLDGQMDQFYARALLQTNYEALSRKQSNFEREMRGSTVRVTTPGGTDISFQIGNRPVNIQDGNASPDRAARGVILIDREIELPAGAIRVAPLEETVNGKIAFPSSVWQGGEVSGLVLTIEKGIVTDVTADTGLDLVLAEMEQAGAAGRAFREFALGFNPLLAMPEGGVRWIPYYGYGAGIVRLSLGDNSELGGKVGGGYVRWNFFVDATVTVGKTVWVRGGHLIR